MEKVVEGWGIYKGLIKTKRSFGLVLRQNNPSYSGNATAVPALAFVRVSS